MRKIHSREQIISTMPENTGGPCHVLIADDDLEMRRMLAWSLREKGFRVTECSDGDSLMKQLGFMGPLEDAETFDLIISDIKMPGVTGMQVLESARAYEDLPPTILITAFGDETTHEKAKKLGATAVLNKPFEIDDLLAKIVQILPFHSSSVQRERGSGKEKTPAAQFPVEITFRHGSDSDPFRNLVLGLAGKLNIFGSFIEHLQVVIDQSNPEEYRKRQYLVTLTVTVPGKLLVAKYDSNKDDGNGNNLYLAIQIAFATLYRQVKKYHQKRKSKKSN